MIPFMPTASHPQFIEVVDYGGGNLGSLCRCLDRLNQHWGVPYRRVTAGSELTGTHPVILPGVGAFGAMMQALDERGFTAPLQAIATANVPLLGICVGLQVLFDGSEEAPGVRGLGLIPGHVVKFTPAPGIKIPQIGWNRLRLLAERGSITTSPHKATPAWPGGGYVYFVNSYVAQPTDPQAVLYTSDYNGTFCAAVQHHHLTAFQFHPEKSGTFGQDLIQRWAQVALPGFRPPSLTAKPIPLLASENEAGHAV
jgi:imidazole glycerol phosphate synthase glutamine amidotransferase subunit